MNMQWVRLISSYRFNSKLLKFNVMIAYKLSGKNLIDL